MGGFVVVVILAFLALSEARPQGTDSNATMHERPVYPFKQDGEKKEERSMEFEIIFETGCQEKEQCGSAAGRITGYSESDIALLISDSDTAVEHDNLVDACYKLYGFATAQPVTNGTQGEAVTFLSQSMKLNRLTKTCGFNEVHVLDFHEPCRSRFLPIWPLPGELELPKNVTFLQKFLQRSPFPILGDYYTSAGYKKETAPANC